MSECFISCRTVPHPSDAMVAVAVFYVMASVPLIHSSTVKGKQGSAPPTHSFTPDCLTLFRVSRARAITVGAYIGRALLV